MYPIEAFESTLSKATTIFGSLSIRFHLTGGITSVAYGEPRLTQDIDLVIDNAATAARLDEFLLLLAQSDFICDERTVREAVANKRMFQLFDEVEILKLDVYPRELIPGELSRSATIEVFEGVRLPIASRVDAALSKLIWVDKGSHKNRRDFRKMFESSTSAERASIRQSCDRLQLSELCDQVLQEPDELE